MSGTALNLLHLMNLVLEVWFHIVAAYSSIGLTMDIDISWILQKVDIDGGFVVKSLMHGSTADVVNMIFPSQVAIYHYSQIFDKMTRG